MLSASSTTSVMPLSATEKPNELAYCAFFNTTKHAEYQFLSNFYPCEVVSEAYGTFQCSEGLYQYQKFAYLNDSNLKKRFQSATGQEAWDLSREMAAQTVLQWDKVAAMEHALACKFKNADLRNQLLQTGAAYLVENSPNNHDVFWSDNGNGTGENRLGQMLMTLRQQQGGAGIVPRPL